MRAIFVFSFGLLLSLAGTAAAQDVRYNFDKSANFAAFKTYRWVTLKDAAQVSQLADQQIKDAIDQELVKKGLTKVDGENADLFVGYQAGVAKEKEMTSYNTGWGYGPGWYGGGWYGGGGGMTTATTSTVYIGQLVLDMYNAQAKTLVWRGLASKTLDVEAKPEKREKNLKKGVAKLLKNYPPPVDKGK